MARHVLNYTGSLLAISVLFVSCAGASARIEVMRGNFAYDRGDYQNALVHYMAAVDEDPADSWTQFNIGSVYYALGEQEAALDVWGDARSRAEQSIDDRSSELSLIFATSYNRGVLFYQQGQYTAAYDELRYALSVNSRSREAKANLELALDKLRASAAAADAMSEGSEAGAGGTPTSAADRGSPDEQTLRILEYVRRKEKQQWFANRDIQAPEQPRDW